MFLIFREFWQCAILRHNDTNNKGRRKIKKVCAIKLMKRSGIFTVKVEAMIKPGSLIVVLSLKKYVQVIWHCPFFTFSGIE
jgi:hypothetical protein